MSSFKPIKKSYYLSSHKKFIRKTLENLEGALDQNSKLNKKTKNNIINMFRMQFIFDFNSFNNSKLILDRNIRNHLENELEYKMSQYVNCKLSDYNDIFDLFNSDDDSNSTEQDLQSKGNHSNDSQNSDDQETEETNEINFDSSHGAQMNDYVYNFNQSDENDENDETNSDYEENTNTEQNDSEEENTSNNSNDILSYLHASNLDYVCNSGNDDNDGGDCDSDDNDVDNEDDGNDGNDGDDGDDGDGDGDGDDNPNEEQYYNELTCVNCEHDCEVCYTNNDDNHSDSDNSNSSNLDNHSNEEDAFIEFLQKFSLNRSIEINETNSISSYEDVLQSMNLKEIKEIAIKNGISLKKQNNKHKSKQILIGEILSKNACSSIV